MLQNLQNKCKKFFSKIIPTNKKIIRSAGLIFIYKFMEEKGLISYIKKKISDRRIKGKIQYSLENIISGIILHILDGDQRFSQYKTNPSEEIFKIVFGDKLPNPSVFLRALLSNPQLKSILDKIIMRVGLSVAIRECKVKNLDRMIIDLDQTGREIHGRQTNVSKGYFANRSKGAKGFQIRAWAVRGIKTILKINLLPGNSHSHFGTERELKYILKALKRANINAVFVGDSGFNKGSICELIESYGQKFIFAANQRIEVRKRGKFAKNKKYCRKWGIIIKERKRPVTDRYQTVFREIYIHAVTEGDQLLFYFEKDRFTNVLISNLDDSSDSIYGLYRKHAEIETILEELKNDFGIGIAHTYNFTVNNIMTKITALSYIVKNSFIDEKKLYWRGTEKKKLCSFQSHFIHTPGLLANQSNQIYLKIPENRFILLKKVA